MTESDLPPAYDGCTCSCHRVPGIKHIFACCGAGSIRTMTTSTTHDHRAKEAPHTMTAQQMAERQALQPSPSDETIRSMKRAAIRLKKATPGLSHTAALDQVARGRGYQGGWWGVVKALKGNR